MLATTFMCAEGTWHRTEPQWSNVGLKQFQHSPSVLEGLNSHLPHVKTAVSLVKVKE